MSFKVEIPLFKGFVLPPDFQVRRGPCLKQTKGTAEENNQGSKSLLMRVLCSSVANLDLIGSVKGPALYIACNMKYTTHALSKGGEET